MRFLIQSVEKAQVISTDRNGIITKSEISRGVLVYFGVSKDDTENYPNKIKKFCERIGNTKMLKSQNNDISATLSEINGEIMVISNFTLYGENNKGAKINFSKSANFQDAEKIYNEFIQKLSTKYKVQTGVFGAMMEVQSTNHGPINYIWDY